MMTNDNNRPRRPMTKRSIRGSLIAVLLVMSPAISACTPGEIEQTIGLLNQSFEQAGVEGVLYTGALIAPEVAMRVGYRLGSLGF